MVGFEQVNVGGEYTFLLTLDLVPVSSLAAGADECWGMIIFNEDYLLYDADKVSASWVVRIARTIAHEMSHLVRRNKDMSLCSIHNI